MTERTRIRTVTCIALLLATTPALAQTPPESGATQTRASGDHSVLLPEVPERLARRVAALERLANRTLVCGEADDREGEFNDDRCYDWYDRLDSGGVASAHAIGRVLLSRMDPNVGGEGPLGPEEQHLVYSLAYQRRSEAVAYLVALLGLADSDSPRHRSMAEAVVLVLPTLTENDVAPIAPWESAATVVALDLRRAEIYAAWCAWQVEHAGETPRAWRAAGIEAARTHSEDTDPTVRFAAISRLAETSHRREARDALLVMLRDAELDASVRTYVSRYGRREGFVSRTELREIRSDLGVSSS